LEGQDYPQLPVLLVDDEEAVLSSEAKVLRSAGITNIITCSDPREVMPLLDTKGVEAVLVDIAMPHISGDVLLHKIHEVHPQIPIIVVTASGDIDVAVRCMKAGAFDYMVKTVEPNRLISGVRRAIEIRRLNRNYSNLRERFLADEIQNPEAFSRIVTRSRRLQGIFAFVEAVAPSAETVLLTGETGTGKELVAEAVHAVSRRTGALVKVNVAGLDDTMFSDTLFGHIKGAYTGAEGERKGLVQQAEEGTLFLDEIGDLSPASQIKLLRLLETHEYYPLGSDIVRMTTARFVVATYCDLVELVENGHFRKDLYYRLQTHEIRVPALRDHKEDLPLLLDQFLEEASTALSKKKLAVPAELLTLLETYEFPGNVRELRSMVFSAVSRQKEKMLSLQPFREAMGIVGEKPRVPVAGEPLSFPSRLPTLKQATDLLVEEALSRSKGNQAIAAGLLGVTPQALSKRLSRKRSTEKK